MQQLAGALDVQLIHRAPICGIKGDQTCQVVKHVNVLQRSADRVELAKIPAKMLHATKR